MKHLLDDISSHFYNEYPREGCGILYAENNKVHWLPCTNIAESDSEFKIDPKEYLKISKVKNIVGIVHSHPDGECNPSEYDIKNCNAIGIPYIIFSYPEMKMYELIPDTLPLYNRIYKFGERDCFTFMRDYYLKLSIDFNDREEWVNDWWDSGENYFSETNIKRWGLHKVDTRPLKKHDMLVFQIGAHVPNHCGVYIGEGDFGHHARGRISCKESLDPFWRKHLVGAYRHEKIIP